MLCFHGTEKSAFLGCTIFRSPHWTRKPVRWGMSLRTDHLNGEKDDYSMVSGAIFSGTKPIWTSFWWWPATPIPPPLLIPDEVELQAQPCRLQWIAGPFFDAGTSGISSWHLPKIPTEMNPEVDFAVEHLQPFFSPRTTLKERKSTVGVLRCFKANGKPSS